MNGVLQSLKFARFLKSPNWLRLTFPSDLVQNHIVIVLPFSGIMIKGYTDPYF